MPHTHYDLLLHSLSPPPGPLAHRESFISGVDFTISPALPTTTPPATSDGVMQGDSRPEPSLSVFHTVAIDAHTPVGSVVNTALPPALIVNHGRAGIG